MKTLRKDKIGEIICLTSSFEDNTAKYFTQQMLEDNLLIQVDTIYRGTPTDCINTIGLLYYTEEDAGNYTIYSDIILAPIQVFRIVKDIVNLYKTQPVKEFLETIALMSIDYQSSSIQASQKSAAKVRGMIVNNIKEVREDT